MTCLYPLIGGFCVFFAERMHSLLQRMYPLLQRMHLLLPQRNFKQAVNDMAYTIKTLFYSCNIVAK
jgi:hypothetical protein